MRPPHRLRVEVSAGHFQALFEAARRGGVRIGWLEFSEPAPPESLGTAARAGALRAVAVGREGSVAVKGRRGQPVLDDLVREHFAGCRLVLVLGGAADAPLLEPAEEGWRVAGAEGRSVLWSTEELLARLGRPRLPAALGGGREEPA